MNPRTGYTAVLLLTAVIAIVGSSRSQSYLFNEVDLGTVADLLTPLLLIALFIERAQEVLVTSWRGVGREEYTNRVDATKARLDTATEETMAALASAHAAAVTALANYKSGTQRFAFVVGLVAGVLTSAVGIRVLEPLVSHDLEITGWQALVFRFVDVSLTGTLLAGGSDGLHKLVSVFTDYFDQARARIARAESTGT